MNNTALYCEGPLKRGLLRKHLRTCEGGGEFAWIPDPHILWNNCLDSFQKQHSCLYIFKISLFVCTGSSLLLEGFLWLWVSAGCFLVAVLGLLIGVASLVEHRFQVWVSVVAPQGL